MGRRRAGITTLVSLAVLASALAAGAPALAHRSGCHAAHSCPSDHHSYVWYDSAGRGWDCAKPGADEIGSGDTRRIVVAALPYRCHAAGGVGRSGTSRADAACGVERWTVKTLQDRPSLLAVEGVTLAYLTGRPAPASLPSTRLPFERHVFRVVASTVLVRPEADGDLHVVLQDAAGRTMIAEAPLPSCAPGATETRRAQMAAARAGVRVCSQAVVTGVAFFDVEHGQTGVAPNAIELHPILAFRCLG